MNLIDPIARHAHMFPERPAVIDADTTLSFKRVWSRVGVVALNLQQAGIRRGDVVAISGLKLRQRLILILALARIGAVSTDVVAQRPRQTRDELFAVNGAVAWVSKDMPADMGNAPRRLDPDAVFKPTPEGEKLPDVVSDVDDDVWRIVLSSGTTGTSKCVAWTHRQAAALQRLSLDAYPTGPRERLLIAVDLSIGFALGHAMQQLAAGGTLVLPRTLEPHEILRTIKREAPTRMLTTPSVAAGLAKPLKEGEAVGQSLLVVMLGGAALLPKLRADLEAMLCPNIVVVYGSTEMGSTARLDLSTFMEFPESAGRVMPWIQAEAVDGLGVPLPPGETGLLRLRAPAMASGYLGDAAATAAAFRDGWYYPGDTGSIGPKGTLVLGGRADHILNLDGVKIDPVDIEDALNSHPSVAESAVAQLSRSDRQELVVLVVAAQPGGAVNEAALAALVWARVSTVPARIVIVDALPMTPAGKLDRKALPAFAAACDATRAGRQ